MRQNVPNLEDLRLEVFEFACHICCEGGLLLALFAELESQLAFEVSDDFGVGQPSNFFIAEVALLDVVKLPP